MKHVLLIICIFLTNNIFTQNDKLFIYNSNNTNSIQNNHSAILTNGDIVMLIMEYEANNDPDNIPIEGLNTLKNIIIKVDSLGNEYWRQDFFGDFYNFNNGFTPSTEFINYNSSILLPFHYNHSENICAYNGDTLSTNQITTNIPAILGLNIGATPLVVNHRKFDENFLCGGNHLLSLKQASSGYFYSYITNNEFNVTFKEKRTITLGLIETDTIYHSFNTSLSLNSPFKTRLDTLPNTSNFLSNSYIYNQVGVLLDSLAEEPFAYTSFNNNYFLSVKIQNDDSKLILREINGNILKEKSFYNVKIIDAKISNLNEILILLNNNKVVKTNIDFDEFSEIEYTDIENHAIKIDFVDNQNPLISNSNSYLISGLIIDKTPTYRNPDKAFVYRGSLSNINKQYVSIKTISNFQTRIYPNPTTGKIRVETKPDVKIKKIKILSILGNEIQNLNINNISSCTINLTNRTKGIYYMEIITNKGIKIEKIMVN